MNFSESFFGKVMSEDNMPSSKRVAALAITFVVLALAVYTAWANKLFDHYVLTALLAFASLLWGLATSAQIIGAIRGNTPTEKKVEDENQDGKQP